MIRIYSPLPDTLTAGRRRYPINTDFRLWLLLSELIKNSGSDEHEIVLALFKIFGREIEITKELSNAICLFISMEGYNPGGKPNENAPTQERLYDFTEDAIAIFSSFYQTYRIDLSCADLHWWKFLALFYALPEDTEMGRRIYMRSRDLSKLTGEELRRARELKERYKLGGTIPPTESNEDFINRMRAKIEESRK
jgi:hypothetical protein